MRLPKMIVAVAVACVSFASLASSASAALIAYEGFDGNSFGFTTGFPAAGGNTGSDTASSLSYGGLVTSGVARSGGASWALKGFLAQPVSTATYGDTGSVWMSWLYKTGSDNNPWTRIQTFIGSDPFGTNERWNLGYVDVNGPGFAVRGSFLPGQSNSPVIYGVTASTTYLLVVNYNFGTAAANDGSITMWVNPVLGGGSPTGGSQTGVTGLDESLMAFPALGIQGSNGALATFDEVRIGHTFADVTPVPEPTSLALLGLGGLALLGRARKRA